MSWIRKNAPALILLFWIFAIAGCGSGEDDGTLIIEEQTEDLPAIEVPEERTPDIPTSVGDDAMILGDWVCEEGSEQEIAFRDEDGTHVFQSYLEGRPMSTGTWRWYGNALAIEGTGGNYRFERVSRFQDRLTLEDGPERWVCDQVLG